MTILDLQTAQRMLDGLSLVLLATALASVTMRRLDTSIRLLAAQGLLLAIAASVVAVTTGAVHAYVAVALTVAVKVVAVPAILLHALRDVRVKREVEIVIPQRQAFLLAIGLVLVAYYAVGPLRTIDGFLTRNALPVAVSMLLIGLYTMLIRKKALTQVIGIVAMENGLYLMAVVAAHGLPLAVEMGIAVDLAVGVLIMGIVSRHIHRTFDTIDTDHLRALRG